MEPTTKPDETAVRCTSVVGDESNLGTKSGAGGGAERWSCELCEAPVEGYEPVMCCSGWECGCMGVPTNPCVCSEECEKALFAGIGTPMEARRIAAGIPWRGGWREKARRSHEGSSPTVAPTAPASAHTTPTTKALKLSKRMVNCGEYGVRVESEMGGGGGFSSENHSTAEKGHNDPKLSDREARRDGCEGEAKKEATDV